MPRMLSITWLTGARCAARRRAAAAVPGRAAEAGDLVDADAVDLLRRLHHLRDDLGQLVEPILLELHAHQLVGARVLGLDQRARRLPIRPCSRMRCASALGRRRLRFGLIAATGARRPRSRPWRSRPRPAPATRLSAISRERSATARSRSVCTCSCARTISVRASSACACALRFLDVLGGELRSRCRSCCISELELRLDLELAQLARACAISRRSVCRSRSMRASSEATIACSRALAVSASLAALIFSISSRWPICACSSSWREQQALLGRLELRLPHRDLGVGLDLGALLLVDGDDLGELAQADRVEGVVLVEARRTPPGRAGSARPSRAACRSGARFSRTDRGSLRTNSARLLVQRIHGVAAPRPPGSRRRSGLRAGCGCRPG